MCSNSDYVGGSAHGVTVAWGEPEELWEMGLEFSLEADETGAIPNSCFLLLKQ